MHVCPCEREPRRGCSNEKRGERKKRRRGDDEIGRRRARGKNNLRKRETGSAESGAIGGRVAAGCVRGRQEEVTVIESLTKRAGRGGDRERGTRRENQAAY